MNTVSFLRERVVIALLAGGTLCAWLCACVTDLNHPPGVRYVRIGAAIFLFAVGFLEYRRPWWGFVLFLIIWPQEFIIKHLLASYVSSFFEALPSYSGGPMASVLCLTYFFRTWKQNEFGQVNDGPRDNWLTAFRILFWMLAAAWVVSVAGFYLRFKIPQEGWQYDHVDLRRLLSPSPRSVLNPLLLTSEYLPPLLLGLILLNGLARPKGAIGNKWLNEIVPPVLLLHAFLAGGTLILIESFVDWVTRNQGNISGPFLNRNLLASVLILILAASLAALARGSGITKLPLIGIAIAATALALATESKNALLMLLALPLLWLVINLRVARLTIVAGVSAALVFAILKAPLPSPDNYSPRSLVRTLYALRSRNWDEASSLRLKAFQAAGSIWREFPITGAGPGSYLMLTGEQARFREFAQAYGCPPAHAHNAPLHLLAEVGPIGSTAWTLIWIILPAAGLVFWKNGNYLLLVSLLIGIVNLLDYSWSLTGFPAVSVILLSGACAMKTQSIELQAVR